MGVTVCRKGLWAQLDYAKMPGQSTSISRPKQDTHPGSTLHFVAGRQSIHNVIWVISWKSLKAIGKRLALKLTGYGQKRSRNSAPVPMACIEMRGFLLQNNYELTDLFSNNLMTPGFYGMPPKFYKNKNKWGGFY